MLGLSQAHISNIESNKDNPSDKLLMKICAVFNVSFDWLKTGIGEMSDNSPIVQEELSDLVREINLSVNNMGTASNSLYLIDCIRNMIEAFSSFKDSYKLRILSVFSKEVNQILLQYKKHYNDSETYSKEQIENNKHLKENVEEELDIAVKMLSDSLFIE